MTVFHTTFGLNRRGVEVDNGLNPEVWPPPNVPASRAQADAAGVVVAEAKQASTTTSLAEQAGVVQTHSRQGDG